MTDPPPELSREEAAAYRRTQQALYDDLVGSGVLQPLTEALMVSRARPVVLLTDEGFDSALEVFARHPSCLMSHAALLSTGVENFVFRGKPFARASDVAALVGG